MCPFAPLWDLWLWLVLMTDCPCSKITSHPSTRHSKKQRPFVIAVGFRSPSHPCESVLRNADGGRKVIFCHRSGLTCSLYADVFAFFIMHVHCGPWAWGFKSWKAIDCLQMMDQCSKKKMFGDHVNGNLEPEYLGVPTLYNTEGSSFLFCWSL